MSICVKLNINFLKTGTERIINFYFFTKIFFYASDIFREHTALVALGFTAIVIFAITAFKNKRLHRYFAKFFWHIPILANIQKHIALMRFSKTVSLLLKAGLPLKTTLETTSEVMPPTYQEAISAVSEQLQKGVYFSSSLRAYPRLFPNMLVSVIATGEKTGQLDAVLAETSDFYEEEALYSLEMFVTLIEPALLIIVGLIVAFMATSLISPVYKVVGTIR